MAKEITQEQLDKAIEKEAAKTAKAVAAATKAETKRILDLVKDVATQAKDLDDKVEKTAIANALRELTTSIKEAA